ncbi:MAG: hypothetical protein K0R75_2041 [Paenibacillaceae bacterium]|nr:hypothetical protein [Paenibacillaceae bacterium]
MPKAKGIHSRGTVQGKEGGAATKAGAAKGNNSSQATAKGT